MKKYLFVLAAVLMTFAACNDNNPAAVDGKLPGKFSVSDNFKVQFSQGNLQYQRSSGDYRFAIFQWEAVGSDNANFILNSPKEDEQNKKWRDLFQPSEARWSSLEIKNGGDNQWFLLDQSQWFYLINRENDKYGKLFAPATVISVRGWILLPDDFELPSDCKYNGAASSFDDESNNYGTLAWASMQLAGAVFLPATGIGAKKTKDILTEANEFDYAGEYMKVSNDNMGYYWELYEGSGGRGYVRISGTNASTIYVSKEDFMAVRYVTRVND